MTGKHRVILIRHAKTEYNETKRISGQADIAILQDTVLEFIDDFTGVIYSSPLKRCRQTLEKLCPKLLDSVAYDSRLTERCMGIFEGNKRFEMQQKFPEYFIKGKLNVFKTIPEGEAFSEFYERVYSFYLDRLAKAEKNVLVCAHNQTLKVLKAILFQDEITLDYWGKNNFENGKMYEYYFE